MEKKGAHPFFGKKTGHFITRSYPRYDTAKIQKYLNPTTYSKKKKYGKTEINR